MNLNQTTPEDILKFVKFNIEADNNWCYDKKNKDMYAFQAEGTAGLCNRLNHFGIALLADEVGMGKTFQALAVVAHQFKEKPSSKVLIIAPRVEVLRQWKNEEYGAFKSHHLIDKSLLPDEKDIGERYNFSDGFNPDHKKIVFAKTTSLSQNVCIEKCQKDLEGFDLVIIDEAHLFRNYDLELENNNRTSNTSKIFRENKIKILLMTATPLHAKKSDVFNMINVFKHDIHENSSCISKNSKSLMDYLMVRRLRIMANGLNKYHYRDEKEIAINLSNNENDIKNELFFAMLQKKMLDSAESKDYSKSKYLLDFLEGTSFHIDDDDEPFKNKTLKKVINQFKGIYKEQPSNEKYRKVLNNIWESDEKALVFVRRRASAKEIARQYIKEFDRRAWEEILEVKNKIPNKRERFDEVLGLKNIDNKLNDFLKKTFVKKYFNENFNDYKEFINLAKGTKDNTIKKNMANNFFDYYDEINEDNFKKFIDEIKDNQEADDSSMAKSKVLDFFKTKKHEKSTAASRFVKKFDHGRSYEKFFTEFLPTHLGYTHHQDKFDLIKSAILHASIGVVELFKCDIKTKNYDSFCKKVERISEKSSFKKEIHSFLEHFDKYEKYLKFNNNVGDESKEEQDNDMDAIETYDTSIFYNAQPVYAYLSDTKNKTVIARFNSPFFPNVLCGTSTLQEGVNLHLQCNKVYHFGSAHSMGDDEQRTGRIDRIHGKMYRDIESNEDSKLDIFYPYLENTFDEENLRSMLCRKRSTEKQIDICAIPNEEKNNENNIVCDKPIEALLAKADKNYKNSSEPFGWEMYSFPN